MLCQDVNQKALQAVWELLPSPAYQPTGSGYNWQKRTLLLPLTLPETRKRYALELLLLSRTGGDLALNLMLLGKTIARSSYRPSHLIRVRALEFQHTLPVGWLLAPLVSVSGIYTAKIPTNFRVRPTLWVSDKFDLELKVK